MNVEWYDLFLGDQYQRLDAVIKLMGALLLLGFPDDDNTMYLALGNG